MKVGVLALQGASDAHLHCMARLGIDGVEVRSREALGGLTHLIIPGGESTTIDHLARLFRLREEIIARYWQKELAILGVCAGSILLGRQESDTPPPFGLLDAKLERNAYGRQADSFARDVHLEAYGSDFHCIFIRAPRFTHVGHGARVLATLDGRPILVEGPGLLATTFHPELTGDSLIHRWFLRRGIWEEVHEPCLSSDGRCHIP